MANRIAPLQHLAKGQRLIAVGGSFAPNGAGAVSADAVKGGGFSVERTSAGLFTITLSDPELPTYAVGAEDPGLNLVHAEATLQLTTLDGVTLQMGAFDPDAKTLEIRALRSGYTAVATTKTITLPAKAEITEATLITATDGLNTVVFGLDVAGDETVAGADVVIDISAATDAPSVAALVFAALDESDLTGWTFTDEEDGTITAVHAQPGIIGNTAWTVVTDADITVENTTPGVDAVAVTDIAPAAGNRIHFMAYLGQG